MTDNPIVHNTLSVDDDGYVTGSAHTEKKDGMTVSAVVSSYTYEGDGEAKMNHVPNVVVSKQSGEIIAEPHSHDSAKAEKAIENALSTAKHVHEHLDEFVD